jgi:hypothetical protein
VQADLEEVQLVEKWKRVVDHGAGW